MRLTLTRRPLSNSLTLTLPLQTDTQTITVTRRGEEAAPSIAQRLKVKGGQLIMCNKVVSPSVQESLAAQRIQAISRGRCVSQSCAHFLKLVNALGHSCKLYCWCVVCTCKCAIHDGRHDRKRVDEIRQQEHAAKEIQREIRGLYVYHIIGDIILIHELLTTFALPTPSPWPVGKRASK